MFNALSANCTTCERARNVVRCSRRRRLRRPVNYTFCAGIPLYRVSACARCLRWLRISASPKCTFTKHRASLCARSRITCLYTLAHSTCALANCPIARAPGCLTCDTRALARRHRMSNIYYVVCTLHTHTNTTQCYTTLTHVHTRSLRRDRCRRR